MTVAAFREVKRTITGEERVYECEPLTVSSRLAIVRFVFTRPLTANGITFPAGGVTEGFFWRDRHYNLYHMLTPDGEPIADRFDVIDHVRIHRDGVRYDDLLLDVWLYPDGRLQIEDEDEVAEAFEAGLLSPAKQQTIIQTRDLILRRREALVAGALKELQQATQS
ncbi:MAG: DUF402 domain-containing protein [Dehalococcoidia bacterium]